MRLTPSSDDSFVSAAGALVGRAMLVARTVVVVACDACPELLTSWPERSLTGLPELLPSLASR